MPDETPPPPDPRLLERPEDFATEAERCEARARWHRAMAKSFEDQAVTLRRREQLARAGTLPRVLCPGGTEGTLGTMDAQSANAGSKVSAAKTKHPLPFAVALHAHGSSPAQWARAQRPPQNPETVRAWLKAKGAGGRQIPLSQANAIEAEFAATATPVPAIQASWPNGIRQG